VFSRVKERYERMVEIAEKNAAAEGDVSPSFLKNYRQLLIEIINVKRNELNKMHKNKEYADHLIKAKERELDLEEARTRKT
jgi:CPA1 family monovalent cation:H+ antiporter